MDTRSSRFETQGSKPDACPPEFGVGGEAGNGHEHAGVDDVMGQAKAAMAEASRHLGEIKEYASHYMAAKLDGIKLSVRNLVLYLVLGVLGAIAGVSIIATAAVMFVVGLVHGLGALFNGRWWAGELIGGLLILGVVMGGAYFAISRMISGSKVKTVGKYEQFERRQREQFGTDVHQRAREVGAGK